MNEILENVPALTVAIITVACAGATELIKRLANGDVKGATTIVVSSLVGLGLGLATGIEWYFGLILGLAASGAITGLSAVSGINHRQNNCNNNGKDGRI